MGQYPNPPRVLKKNHIPFPNPFKKFEPCPIRGGAGRVPEKTLPIAIPSHDSLFFNVNIICFGFNKTLKL